MGQPKSRGANLTPPPPSITKQRPGIIPHHPGFRKNYGCTHFIIGRDMAGCKSNIDGEDFYGPYEAQEFAQHHAVEMGMQTVWPRARALPVTRACVTAGAVTVARAVVAAAATSCRHGFPGVGEEAKRLHNPCVLGVQTPAVNFQRVLRNSGPKAGNLHCVILHLRFQAFWPSKPRFWVILGVFRPKRPHRPSCQFPKGPPQRREGSKKAT